ncbi:O-antigen ligase family protein [Candidatus Daviesbacteria bacterium]|nr:O-antigen ligase family protein [Candidatus Daviesbacteria bacterium]
MLQKAEHFLLFLTLLFLPTQLGKHFWPSFSYIYSLKVDYLSPTVYFWDLLVVGLILVWILQKAKINSWSLNLWMLFMLTQFISLVGAQNLGAGLVRFEQFSVAGLFGVYLASSKCFSNCLWQNKVQSSKLYWPLVLGIAGESAIAIAQFIKGATLGLWILGERTFTITTPAIAKFDFYGIEFLRPYATFPHPNVLAGYLLVVVVILRRLAEGSPANAGPKQVGRFPAPLGMTIVVNVVAGLTIFLTMSRTAIAVSLLLLPFLLKRKWLILAGVLLLAVSPFIYTRFSSLFSFDNLSLIRREQLSEAALQLLFKSPFFGVGLNNFIPALANNLITGPSRFLQPVHNIFLLTLAETGIIGFLGLIAFIFYPMIKSKNFLIWVVIIFLGLFDHYFLTLPQGYRLLFLVWGLSFSALSSKSHN